MPEQPSLDIADAESWFGLRPGMTRDQVLECLQAHGVDESDFDDGYIPTTIDGVGLDLWFEDDGAKRLRQISADDGTILWNGKPLLDARVDDALRAVEPLGRSPMWDATDVVGTPFPKAGNIPTGPFSDERLLEEGTVWLPDRGIGLAVCNGEIIGVAWRETRDLPAQFAGPVTEVQRQLSQRPDLGDYLRKTRAAQVRAATPKNPLAFLNTVLVIVCLALLGLVGRAGFHDMQRWNQAPIFTGKFVGMELVPRKKHFDLGPERLRRLMPDDPTRTREMYHVEYLDPAGRQQTVALEGADFYVPPRESGEDVQFAYIAGDPPEIKGPSRIRDAAFLDYLPWGIAVGVLFVVGQMVIGLLPRLLRLASRSLLPKRAPTDSDRPELR
jgi:hypothetical protein